MRRFVKSVRRQTHGKTHRTMTRSAIVRRTWYRLAVFISLLALTAGFCIAEQEIQDVQYVSQTGLSQVIVRFESPPRYESTHLNSPPRVFVDIHDAKLESAIEVPAIPSDDPLLRGVRIAQNRPGVVRVVMDLKALATPRIRFVNSPPKLVLEWDHPTATDSSREASGDVVQSTNPLLTANETTVSGPPATTFAGGTSEHVSRSFSVESRDSTGLGVPPAVIPLTSVEPGPVQRVQDVEYILQARTSQVVVRLERPPRYKSSYLGAPPRFFMDIHDASIAGSVTVPRIPKDDPLLRAVRVAQNRPGVVRIVADLKAFVAPRVTLAQNPPRLVLEWDHGPATNFSHKTPDEIQHPAVASPSTDVTLNEERPAPPAATNCDHLEKDLQDCAASDSNQTTSVAIRISGTLPSIAEPMPPSDSIEPPSLRLPPADDRSSDASTAEVELPSGERGPALETQADPTVLASSAPRPIDPAIERSAATTRGFEIPRVNRPPEIDDYLNGPPSVIAAEVTDFRQRKPGDGVPSSQETKAYLSYDDKNLYVVFVCTDAPDKIRANMTRREGISRDDVVAVYLDTFLDQQRAYMFALNPLGIQLDGIVAEGQSQDLNFDTLWHSKGRLTPTGYVVSMTIPFKSLRFAGRPVQQWGIALHRTIVRNNEETYWPYITNRQEGFVPQFAVMDGIRDVSPGRNVQLIPYGTFATARLLQNKPPSFVTQNDIRGGIDGKVVLRDALTLDLTVNPDFSQVESDDPQVTVNKRFEVFFPEKRPFFIENATLFDTPMNLFFSRRIIDPQFGGRLTGKHGPWAFGALAADDRASGQLVDEDEPGFGSRATNGVMRLQREFSGQSTIGVLATAREFGDSSNQVVSLDTRLRLNPRWFFRGQIAKSYTQDSDGRKYSGPAYIARLSRTGRNLNMSTEYEDLSPNFNTDLGFTERVDVRKVTQYVGYRWWPESSTLLSFGPTFLAQVNYNRENRLQDWYLSSQLEFEFAGQTGLTFTRTEQYELFSDQGFRQHSNDISFFSGWKRWLFVYGSLQDGTSVNYSPGSGLLPFVADGTTGSLVITIRPTQRFRFEQTYIYSRLGTTADPRYLNTREAASIFNNHLFRTKMNYQFTRALSLRTIVDYYSLLPNSALIDEGRYKQVRGDVLLTYLLNPWTAFHIGYTDKFDNVMIDPIGRPRIVPTNYPGTSTARQFYVKLSYLLGF